MEYELIYDFAREGSCDSAVLIIPIGILATTILIAIFREQVNRYSHTKISKQFSLIMVAVALLIGGGHSFDFIWDYIAFKDAVNGRKYFEVEGRISEYNRGRARTPNLGGLTENFLVNNTKFELHKTRGGYTKMQEDGSPLNQGDYVRISYLISNNDRVILRLEKAK
jgi:hypothetical protein